MQPCHDPSISCGVAFPIGGIGVAGAAAEEGSFSIVDWRGYPGGFKPDGPFRILSGSEYEAQLALKRASNAALHKSLPELKGLQIHEIQPVKFNGSPVALSNKVVLSPATHLSFTQWWAQLLRDLTK
jgi:filamentous hemagglutinin